MNDQVTYRNLKYLQVYEYRLITSQYCSLLTLSDLVVKTHGLGSTPVQSVTSVQRRVSDNGMSLQIVGTFELAFPMYFDSTASTLTARS